MNNKDRILRILKTNADKNTDVSRNTDINKNTNADIKAAEDENTPAVGGYISGEEISSLLGISRAAVNASVKALKAEGYEISSVTNKGYRLIGEPDVLTAASVGACLSEERMRTVEVFESIDSTNSELMRRAVTGAENGQVIVADEQRLGRGRKGRAFLSPGGKGVYLSYLFKPTEELKQRAASAGDEYLWASLTSWTAVAMADAVEKVCGMRPGIKWVNDLYINGRKLTGILTQMNTSAENMEVESIVIGIGINVRQSYEDFEGELKEKAGSLYTETGKLVMRAELAAGMIKALDRMTADWPQEKESYYSKYVADSILIGKDVDIITAGRTEAVRATGIDKDFGLIVAGPDGAERHIISADVSVRL